MVAFEAGGLKQRMTDVGSKALSGIKDTATTAVEKSKSVASEAGRLGSKAWERVKEGPVGMWVREKRANRLATKIERQQQRVDELSSMIQGVGDDYASATRLGQEQMMHVDKINKYAERRRELAAKLSNHYNKKLEKPEERRRGIEDGRKDAVSKRDALVAKQEKYKTVFNRFRERQANLLGSRAYERSEEMASIAKSLSAMADQMKSLEEDIVTVDRVIESANKDVTKWDADYSGTKRQIQHWSDISLNGRHGTGAARKIEASSKGPVKIDVPAAVKEPASTNIAANDNQREEPKRTETGRSQEGVSGKALYAFFNEVFSEDLRISLKERIGKLSKADVMTGPEGRGKVDAFIKLWDKFAAKGTPKVDAISGPALKFLENHRNKEVDLVEFGVLLLEEGGFSAGDIKTGIGRIAEQWNSSLEKQKQAA